MLVAALVLSLLATFLFLVDFFKSNWTTLTSAGLAALAGGISAYFVYLLEETGKL